MKESRNQLGFSLCILMGGLLISSLFLTACGKTGLSGADKAGDGSSSLPKTLVDSYYSGQGDPAFEYFKHASVQKFAAMWVKEETGNISDPHWNYDSFTKVVFLDQKLADLHPDESLYCCTFSDGGERYGYFTFAYDKSGPSISNYGVQETTPYMYDLKANMDEISQSLKETDLDLSTTTASRVAVLHDDKKNADQAILFTDAKGNRYIGYFGEPAFTLEKCKKNGQEVPKESTGQKAGGDQKE